MSWSSFQSALPNEARMCGEQDDETSPYEEWDGLMNAATDELECRRPDEEGGNSEDCTCSPCRLAYWWDRLEPLERGLLFAGMCQQGFRWSRKPEGGDDGE